MNAVFALTGWALRVFGWVFGLFIVLTLACAAVYIVAWGILWRAMGW